MSVHSKWAQIKHRKGAADKKKGALFSKLSKEITVVAKQGGGDIDANFRLRLAVDKAREANMPKENIDRAVKRGSGEGAGEQIEEILYEGFGPEKTPILIQCLTDNKNRAVSEIKHLLNKSGGSLLGANAIKWMFDYVAIIEIPIKEIKNREELELKLIDLEVKDYFDSDENLVIYADSTKLMIIKEALEKEGLNIAKAEIGYVFKEKKELTESLENRLENLFSEFDDNDDINSYYSPFC